MGARVRTVSVWALARIHVLSVLFGAWVVCSKVLRWFLWYCGVGSGSTGATSRDNPPGCLVEAGLGQHKYVKLKGIKLHYVESGNRDNPLILLLHGFPDFWLSWRHQIPVLSSHFRVVALDLKGFGDSDKPLWRRWYNIDIILEELRQFIQSLGVNSCTIIGHDLGALLGWHLVHQTPRIVDKFVAVSCPHPNVYWQSPSDGYKWLNYVQLPYIPEINALKEDVKMIEQYHPHLAAKDPYLEAYKFTFSRKEDWTGPINYYRNLPLLRISDKCDQITVPVILITGSKDEFIKLESIVKSTEYCEKFYMKIIEDTRHFPHQENPTSFNNVILKYLIKNDKPAPLERSPSKRLMEGLFGAVSNTMKYGNSVIDSVQKKTNGVVNSIPSIGLSLNLGSGSECKD